MGGSMKSFLIATGVLVSLFFTAGAALSYDCYEKNPPPPPAQPCVCPQYQECRQVQYKKQKQPCPSSCVERCDRTVSTNPFNYDQCDRPVVRKASYVKKKKAPRYSTYQCQTEYTEKTEQVTTVQCKLCGTRCPKGVNHRCNTVQYDPCKKKQPVNVVYQCDTKRCGTCGKQYRQGRKHNCCKVRSQSCDTRYQPAGRYEGYAYRTGYRKNQKKDCFRKNSCRQDCGQYAPRNCDLPRNDTMERRWQKWFTVQEQRI